MHDECNLFVLVGIVFFYPEASGCLDERVELSSSSSGKPFLSQPLCFYGQEFLCACAQLFIAVKSAPTRETTAVSKAVK